MPGRFITLEGGEGAGKSTLAAALAAELEAKAIRVVRTREPGGTPGADAIRALLVRGETDRWSALTETLLLTAARHDHVERRIAPALADGAWVLCDRFTDSTRAYQVEARGVPAATLQTLAQMIGAPTPDLTLILDIAPAAGLARTRNRAGAETRYEVMPLDFHDRVRAGFLRIAVEEPQRCVVIDASQRAADVLRAAKAAVSDRLGVVL